MTKLTKRLAARWKDLADLALGLWLVTSPWALGFASQKTMAGNAWSVGGTLTIAALVALIASEKWEEWMKAALAGWLVVSPFLLEFNNQAAATWNQVATGVLVGVLSFWAAKTTEEDSLASKA